MYNIDIYVDKLSFIPTDGEPFNDHSITVDIEFGKKISMHIKQNEFLYDIKKCLCEVAPDFPPRNDEDAYDPALDSLEKLFRIPEDALSLDSIEDAELETVEIGGFHLHNIRSGVSFLVTTPTTDLVEQFEESPLSISVWNSDTLCVRNCAGSAKLLWDSDIIEFVKNTVLDDAVEQSITKKFILTLLSEDSAMEIGKMSLYVRLRIFSCGILTSFGETVIDGIKAFAFKQSIQELFYTCQIFGKKDDLDIGPIKINEEIAAKYRDEPCPLEVFLDETRNQVKINDVVGPCRRSDCPAAVKIRSFLARQWAFKQMSKGFAFEGPGHGEDCGCCVCIAKKKSTCATIENRKNADEDDTLIISSPATERSTTCLLCGGVCESGKSCYENDLPIDEDVPLLESYRTCDTFLKPCSHPNCNCQQDIENEKINFRHSPHCDKFTHKSARVFGKKRVKDIWSEGHPPSIQLTKCPVGTKCCLRQTPFKQILKNLPK